MKKHAITAFLCMCIGMFMLPVFAQDSGFRPVGEMSKAACEAKHKAECEECLALYYPKCPQGQQAVGCNICTSRPMPQMRKSFISMEQCTSETKGECEKCMLLYYPKCPEGQEQTGLCACTPKK